MPRGKKKNVDVVEDVGVLSDELQEIQNKHDSMIEEISDKLMTKSEIKSGGPEARVKYEQEKSAYEPVLPELNGYRKQLGLPPIGLAHLREE